MEEMNKSVRFEAVASGKKKYVHYLSFKRKDEAVRNIEIIIVCVIAFIAGMGIYQVL